MSRIDLRRVVKFQQLAMQRVIHHRCHHLRRVSFAAGKIRPAHVANKQRVASENFLRLRRIVNILAQRDFFFPCSPLLLFRHFCVRDQNGNTLRRMSRRLHDPQDNFADLNLVTVFHSPMRKRRASFLAKHDLCTGPGRQLAMAADEIRVQVRLDHILDLEALRLSFVNVLINIALRIYYRRLALRTDQVRSMRQAAKIELFEVHMNLPRNAPAFFWDCGRPRPQGYPKFKLLNEKNKSEITNCSRFALIAGEGARGPTKSLDAACRIFFLRQIIKLPRRLQGAQHPVRSTRAVG